MINALINSEHKAITIKKVLISLVTYATFVLLFLFFIG